MESKPVMHFKDKAKDLDETVFKASCLGPGPGPSGCAAGSPMSKDPWTLLSIQSKNHSPGLSPGFALTSGAVEAGGAGVPAVGGEALGAVVAGRAGEAGGLASQVAVGASRARLGEAGPPGTEVALGAGAPLL